MLQNTSPPRDIDAQARCFLKKAKYLSHVHFPLVLPCQVLAPHFHPRERFTEISRENPFHPQPPAGTPINLVSTKQLTGCQKRKSDPRGYQMNTLLES